MNIEIQTLHELSSFRSTGIELLDKSLAKISKFSLLSWFFKTDQSSISYLGDDTWDSAKERFTRQRNGTISTIIDSKIPQIFITHNSKRGVEEVSEDSRRKALIETERTLLAKDFRGDSKSVGGASGGKRLTVELKSSLCKVYREGRGFRHHGREWGQ